MTEQEPIVGDRFEHRTLATCRSCGDAIWYLDLEDTSTSADGRISYCCVSCGAHAYGDRGAQARIRPIRTLRRPLSVGVAMTPPTPFAISTAAAPHQRCCCAVLHRIDERRRTHREQGMAGQPITGADVDAERGCWCVARAAALSGTSTYRRRRARLVLLL
jgi:hypothetical protein